jgi:ankyrin repeat protein
MTARARFFRHTLPAVLLATTLGCGRNERPPEAAAAPPVSAKAASSLGSEESAPDIAEARGPLSEGERGGAPSRIADERRLAAAGFVTRDSGLPVHLLEASFVGASCASGGGITPMFLDAGYSPDSENSSGLTPLHCAALRGEADNVRLLLSREARVDAGTWQHRLTPLHYAAMKKQMEIVALLVEAGADVSARSTLGQPLMLALASPKAGRSPSFFDRETETPPEFVTFMRLDADAGSRDEDGNTPLHYAAERSNEAWVADLLRRDVEVDARNTKGETPFAVAMNHLTIDGTVKPGRTMQMGLLKQLIEAGANVNVMDAEGAPLVIRAAQTPDLVPLFHEAGADFNAVGRNCATFWRRLLSYAWGYMPEEVYVSVFDAADRVRKIEAEPTFEGKRCDNALHTAAATGDDRIVGYFLERGLDPNAPGEYDRTSLHILLSSTPMDRRSQEPALKALALLIEAGADVNARDRNGNSPLKSADRRPAEFKTLLVREGAR